MPIWLLVAIGSACGGVARWAVTRALDGQLPWGTLAVNVLGGALIGVCYAVFAKASPQYAMLAVGALGGFTTFSSYSLQTLTMIQDGRIGWAIAYALVSVLACLLACWAGWGLGRAFQS